MQNEAGQWRPISKADMDRMDNPFLEPYGVLPFSEWAMMNGSLVDLETQPGGRRQW